MGDISFLDFASDVNIPMVVVFSAVFLILNIVIFRRSYYGIADPAFLFIFFNCFSLVATFFVAIARDNYYYIFDLFVFNVAFFLAMLFVRPVPRPAELRRAMIRVCGREADVFIAILSGLVLFASVVFWISVGVPVFADIPSEAKVAYYEGGFGGVKYMQIISPPIICLYAMLNLVRHRISRGRSLSMKIYILFSAIISGSMGSKSGLIFLFFSAGYVVHFVASKKVKYAFKKLMFAFLGAALILVFLVLATTSEGAFDGFALRLFASGDIFFFWYFYDLHNTLSNWRPLEFLFYLVSPILGMFKIIEQDYPIGAYVLNESVGYPLSGFGPNAQLPVVLRMYFSGSYYLIGVFFGWMFCFIRAKSHFLVRKIGIFGFCFYVTLFFNATFIFIDINYYFSLIAASMIVFVPVACVSALYLHFVGYRAKRSKNGVNFV